MGIFSSIWKGVKKIGKSLFSSASNTAVSNAGNRIGNKIVGVPNAGTPDQRLTAQQGSDYRQYLNAAFPGTTPWEQLGASSPAGALGSAALSAKTQISLQNKQIRSNERMQNRALSLEKYKADAGLIASTSNVSKSATDSALATLKGEKAGKFTTQTTLAKDRQLLELNKIAKEVDNLSQDARLKGQQILSEIENAKLKKQQARVQKLTADLFVVLKGAGIAATSVAGTIGTLRGIKALRKIFKNPKGSRNILKRMIK